MDNSSQPQPQPPDVITATDEYSSGSTPVSEVNNGAVSTTPDTTADSGAAGRQFKSITVTGKVPLEQYTQLFQSFIMPLAHNNIEIEIRITGRSTRAKPLTESSQEYKIVKESAKQLGLNFEEEDI